MPVRFEINDGSLYVRQSFDFPTIYLDHWAISLFSRDKPLGQKFIQALRASGGSLVISHANLAEITGHSDTNHAKDIAEFLEEVLPNVYFALFDMRPAIQQEIQERDTSVRLMLPPDIGLLKEVARQRPDDLQPFTIAGIIKTIAEHRDRLGATWRQANQNIADRINEMRQTPEFLQTARNFKDHPPHIPTLAVFQELPRPIYLDSSMRISPNDGGDFQHAILAIAYCDLVLLDGKWEDLNERMVRRFTELGHSIFTAKVFSLRRNGVGRFLGALEAG